MKQPKRKITEALSVLKDLGMPKAQQNERSALCLLALLHLKPKQKWSEVSSWMTLIAEIYGNNSATIGESNHEISFQGGGSLAISKKLAFDFGVSAGLTHTAPDWLARSGLTLIL